MIRYPTEEMTIVMAEITRLLPGHAVILIAEKADDDVCKIATNLVLGKDMFDMLAGAVSNMLEIMTEG